MKKTIITLLALAGLAGATEFTSNSYITPCGNASWDQNTANIVKKDLFSISQYKTEAEIKNTYTAYRGAGFPKTTSYSAIYRVQNANVNTLNTRNITLSDLYNSSPLDSQVSLVSYSFITGNVASNVTTGLKVQVYDGANLLGTSNEVSYSFDDTKANSFGVGTFTFTDALTLTSDSQYTFKLVDATTLNQYTGNVYLAQFRTNTSGGNGGQIDGQAYNGDYPVISIATMTVPEPTTATLSLLALAGLAARRRK